jgi:putative phosphoribosyl transferase
VLGLPRGGVEVAYEVAERLEAELDVLVVRKIGAPHNPELGIGAIASYGARFLNVHLVESLRILPETVDQIERREWMELQRQEKVYRRDRPPPRVEGRTVILVDDGLATGGTARAAVQAIRGLNPKGLVLAVPVGPLEVTHALWTEVDELVCPLIPPSFQAVGQWYAHFDQTSDEKVVERLQAHRIHLAAGKA